MLTSGSSMKRSALLFLGLGEGASGRANEKLKTLSVGGFLASMYEVIVAIKPEQHRFILSANFQ